MFVGEGTFTFMSLPVAPADNRPARSIVRRSSSMKQASLETPVKFGSDEFDSPTFRWNALHGRCQNIEPLVRRLEEPKVPPVFADPVLQMFRNQFGNGSSPGLLQSVRGWDHQVDIVRRANVRLIPEEKVDSQTAADDGRQADSPEGFRQFA